MNITRRRTLEGMAAAAVALPLGIGASGTVAAETDAPLLAMIEEAGTIEPYAPLGTNAEKIDRYDRLCALFDQIETTPAKTLEGVMAKLRCLDHQFRTGGITPDELVASALADLERLAGKA